MSTNPQMITPSSPRSHPAARSDDSKPIAVVESTDLIANGKLVYIQHRGEIYSLRQTRLGKLILTK